MRDLKAEVLHTKIKQFHWHLIAFYHNKYYLLNTCDCCSRKKKN